MEHQEYTSPKQILLSKLQESLDLEQVYETNDRTITIASAELSRPGLQFSGYFDFFARERMQILGKAEMTYYLQLDYETRCERLDRYFSYHPPCLIICRGMDCPQEMIELAKKHDVPLLRTELITTRFSGTAMIYLNAQLAPRQQRPGVLIDVHGVGLLLTGESGIGKSESALEMVKRGHRLVADDVVDITRVSERRLVGQAPDAVRHFMEIRGVGLIDVRSMYGISSISPTKSIDLNIHLELWNEHTIYDRLGTKEDFTEILGVHIPKLTIPVRPGRNLAITLEVAARNHSMKAMGYNAAKEFEQRLTERIAANAAAMQP